MNTEEICMKATEVVKTAAGFIRTQYTSFNPDTVRSKSLNSLVSFVDEEAEKLLVKGLQELLPASGFLTEEQTVERSAKKYVWIVDPLDGTTNFIHRIPVFSVSVALYENDKALVGIVMDVMRNECFYAFRYGGAYMNDRRIQVSDKSALSDCLVATGFPYEVFDYSDTYLSIIKRLMPRCRGIRRLGSAAIDLAYTACGRFDAFFEYNLNAWDVAGGAIIVQEAGGMVSDFSLTEEFISNKEILASNTLVHHQMIQQINP
ncbi:inositol monophosphatase [Bacteroidota bacterium]|nr:inositol monophosphatase [Bacteroidota bacterium]